MAIVKCCDYTHADKSVSAPTSEKIMGKSDARGIVAGFSCLEIRVASSTSTTNACKSYFTKEYSHEGSIPSQFRVMKNQPEIEFCEAEHLDAPDRGGTEVQGKQ